jgi:hypothetical protein
LQLVSACELFSYISAFLIINIRGMKHLCEKVRSKATCITTSPDNTDSFVTESMCGWTNTSSSRLAINVWPNKHLLK